MTSKTSASAPNLRDIERALYALWNRKAAREQFLSGCQPDAVHPGLIGYIDERGVRLYANMMEIGRLDLMASIYPICRELLGKSFNTLVTDYFEVMPAEHFNLNQSARRFSEYLQTAEKQIKRYPFLGELAEYEWLELAVMEDEAEIDDSKPLKFAEQTDIDPVRLAAFKVKLNPTLVARTFKYPIADIIELVEAGSKMPRRQKAETSRTLFFRCPQEEHCRFLQVGELTYELVAKMAAEASLGELLTYACSRSGGDANETVSEVLALIEELQEKGLILSLVD